MKQKVVNEYITDALFDLLKGNELSKISILELIKRAGVCRSSFYRNYFLLEDVIIEWLNSLFEHILALYPLSLNRIRFHIKDFFSELLKERERLSILKKRGLLYLLDDTIYRLCVFQM